MDNFRKLNKDEEDVIVNKKTEMPFTGEYDNYYENGVYICKRCGYPLFSSDDKFNSHSGWPSFDKKIGNSIIEIPDGNRIEIQCRNCKGHLGHVFRGEGMTELNTRYCVNSISLIFKKNK